MFSLATLVFKNECKLQSPVELRSQPNVSTLQSSVFISVVSALAEHVCDTKNVEYRDDGAYLPHANISILLADDVMGI